MRRARVKVAAGEGQAFYHCISRTVNGERLLDDVAKEMLRKQIWQIADFCGVQVLTYTILSNHFHILLRVPQSAPVSDAELLRRYQVLYPKPSRYQTLRLEVIRSHLENRAPEADAWRRQMLALMNDVSQFMKLLKQRFTRWFNQRHDRYGTLWSERFKSVLIEPDDHVLQTVAAYIDLNAVRSGLTSDPKDYRFCGYAESVAGHAPARSGLEAVVPGKSWRERLAAYRQILYGTGATAREGRGAVTPEAFAQVMAEGGRLPLATALRCRWRYFSDGRILGGRAFVAAHMPTGVGRFPLPAPVPAFSDWGDLAIAHQLRGAAWGGAAGG